MSRTNSYCSWWKLVVRLTQKGDDLIQFSTGSYTQLHTQHLHLEAEWTLQTHPKLNFQSLCHPTSLPLSTNLLPLHLSPTQFLATHPSHASNQKPFFFPPWKHLWCLSFPTTALLGNLLELSLQNIFRFTSSLHLYYYRLDPSQYYILSELKKKKPSIFIFLKRNIIDLPCSVSFCRTMRWISYKNTYICSLLGLPPAPFHPTLLGHHRAPS